MKESDVAFHHKRALDRKVYILLLILDIWDCSGIGKPRNFKAGWLKTGRLKSWLAKIPEPFQIPDETPSHVDAKWVRHPPIPLT
jgi:hypothetical protein